MPDYSVAPNPGEEGVIYVSVPRAEHHKAVADRWREALASESPDASVVLGTDPMGQCADYPKLPSWNVPRRVTYIIPEAYVNLIPVLGKGGFSDAVRSVESGVKTLCLGPQAGVSSPFPVLAVYRNPYTPDYHSFGGLAIWDRVTQADVILACCWSGFLQCHVQEDAEYLERNILRECSPEVTSVLIPTMEEIAGPPTDGRFIVGWAERIAIASRMARLRVALR